MFRKVVNIYLRKIIMDFLIKLLVWIGVDGHPDGRCGIEADDFLLVFLSLTCKL